MTTATAPGKIILFGEHAVVYGRPAIAAPVMQLKATAVIRNTKGHEVKLIAPQIQKKRILSKANDNDALAMTVRLFKEAANVPFLTNLSITVKSDIPIAGGMGSGAAITAAVLRALATHYQKPEMLNPAILSELTYEVEKIYHGTPSGIDNTVVAYKKPLYFVRQQPDNHIEPFTVGAPLHFIIGMSGVSSSTKAVVSDVRRRWEAEPDRFESIFDACGDIADSAHHLLKVGNHHKLGRLMQENHRWLQKMTVSVAELDRLVEAALNAGALGAKLSGAGRGGNMIALVTPETKTAVHQALLDAGATAVYATALHP